MALFQRPNKPMIHNIQFIRLIGELGLQPHKALMICKGKCFDPSSRENSVTRHIYFKFPAGTEWWVCEECGAGVIFDDADDRTKSLQPTELEQRLSGEYIEFTETVRENASSGKSKNTQNS